MGPLKSDNNMRLIKLTLITLSGLHWNTILKGLPVTPEKHIDI